METLAYKLDTLAALFVTIAEMGDVSLQMDTTRGGVFIQVSNREWPDGIEEIVNDFLVGYKLVVEHNRYSTVIHFKEDKIR